MKITLPQPAPAAPLTKLELFLSRIICLRQEQVRIEATASLGDPITDHQHLAALDELLEDEVDQLRQCTAMRFPGCSIREEADQFIKLYDRDGYRTLQQWQQVGQQKGGQAA